MVYIGRLKRHKLPHHAILAFMAIKKQLPDTRLWVIGDGYMRKEFKKNMMVTMLPFMDELILKQRLNY